MQRLADLREILQYVPQYRDKLFVIAMDGAVVNESNFRNLLLDISLLRSLRIGVVLVHGAGQQIDDLAKSRGITPSNIDGTGVTDDATLELAKTAAYQVSHVFMAGLSALDLYCAISNGLVAHPAGILQGIDYLNTGRVDRVDTKALQAQLSNDIIPVIPPLGFDGEGSTFRLNSDAVAVEVASALNAAKLIFLSREEGIQLFTDEKHEHAELVRQMALEDAEQILQGQTARVVPSGLSKLRNAVRALRKGVSRVHVIDCQVEEGILAEVFSNTGIGTLIYGNEYLGIRPAQKKDVGAIYALVRVGIENDELLQRNIEEIEDQIGDFYVFEIDQTPVGCVALHHYPETKQGEIACMCVHPRYENQKIGARLMQYAESYARQLGVQSLICLSTQAFNYFVQKGGYKVGTPADLPAARRTKYDSSGRHSVVLTKQL